MEELGGQHDEGLRQRPFRVEASLQSDRELDPRHMESKARRAVMISSCTPCRREASWPSMALPPRIIRYHESRLEETRSSKKGDSE